jgi:two-component system chemotaxis sensor kinase CheA
VVISDATAALLHERAEAEQRDLVRLFVKLRNDASGVANFIDEGTRIIAQLADVADLKATLRAIHTLKGNAAIFGQDVVAAACHRLEDSAAEAGELAPEAVEQLQQGWARFLERARSIQGDDDSTDVNANDLDALIRAIEAGEPTANVLEQLKMLRHERVDAQLTRIADQASAIATRLGKRVACHVEAGRLRLAHDVAGPVFSALVHAVRNAVDHGIEVPEVREAAGKPAAGRIELRAAVERDVLVLSVKDDGAGVNWDAVQRKAQGLGLPSQTPHDLEDALFADGVSTRNEATTLSGRGVGMSAIRAEARARGGDARVLSVAGQGTTLIVHIPLTAARVALAS